MRGAELYRDFWAWPSHRINILAFQSTTHIGPLKGPPNAIKRVWEPKKGGKAKS